MTITDWDEWCRQHHIKIKGSDENDRRSNEGEDHNGIRRAEVETPGSGNG